MKKTLFFGLIVASLGFTACNKNNAISGEDIQKKGMVLKVTVEEPAVARAAIIDSTASWQFAFAENDEIKVTNSEVVTDDTYYTFTNNGTEFKSEDAEPTLSDATWFAYFPSNSIDLTDQAGTMESAANLYALAGQTTSATTGDEGLTIPMSAKVAILKIENYEGYIDIQVKTSATNYVTGLTAASDGSGFTVVTSTTSTSLFTTTQIGEYYVVVPAGVQLSVKNGSTTISSTKSSGLAAGKYYELIVGLQPNITGTAKATINGSEVDVNWVQLWYFGPKFAVYNVGVTDGNVHSYGGYYCWGGHIDKDPDHYCKMGSNVLTGDDDTATNLWGNKWRMPTQEELENLCKFCDREWTDNYNNSGVSGLIITGRWDDYQNNSIFLPAAGWYISSKNEIGVLNGNGSYWSSTPDPDPNFVHVYTLWFGGRRDRGSVSLDRNGRGEGFGYSVRAVVNEVVNEQ